MTVYTGWVKVWRQVFDHPVVGIKTGRTAQWVDLVSLAAFEPAHTLQRGELIASRRFLCERWAWSESRVRHFIFCLEKAGMVRVKIVAQASAHLATKLTICNYEEYQAPAPTEQPTKRPTIKKRRKKEEVELSKDSSRRPTDDMSVLEAFLSYNRLAEKIGLPQSRTLTPSRKKSIRARLREHGMGAWQLAMSNLEKSSFLQGRGSRDGWTASLDFVLQASSFAKLIDGAYGNGAHAPDNDQDRYRKILQDAADQGDLS